MFRPVYEENKNFFPEYYVIPVDVENQQDIQAVNDMVEWLLRNDVRVKRLTADTTVNGVTYKAGTVIVDMHHLKPLSDLYERFGLRLRGNMRMTRIPANPRAQLVSHPDQIIRFG